MIKNIQKTERALSLAKQLREKYNFPDSGDSSLKLLDLFGLDLKNTNIYRGVILEFMAVYYNDLSVRRRFNGTAYSSKVLEKLMELYQFFTDIEEDNLQVYLDILRLETQTGVNDNYISNLECRHGVNNFNPLDGHTPF